MVEEIIRKLESNLLEAYDPEQIQDIEVRLRVALEDYIVTRKSTALIPYLDVNADVIKQFGACMIIEGKAKTTVNIYCKVVKAFSEYYARPLIHTTVSDIKGWLAHLLLLGTSKRTCNNYRNYLSAFFRWCFSEKIMPYNPCADVHAVKYEQEIKPCFTDIEIDMMRRSELSLRDRALIETLLSSGIRVSELCNLKWCDVNTQTLKVHVRSGKGGKDRITYISRVAAHHINAYLQSRNDLQEWMFLSRDNRKAAYQQQLTTSGVRQILTQIGELSGVQDVHPHKFRHTMATSLYNKGMDLHEIQMLLGHNSLDTTLKYISSDNETLGRSYLKHMA